MKVEKREWKDKGTVYVFFCNGCENYHYFDKRWTFNGDMDNPTFSPSLLIRSGHYMPEHKGSCWCTYNAENKDDLAPFSCSVCHSFVRNGHIEYLNDCTHHLAGKTIQLENVEE